jgi:hypothetical protein
MDSKEITELHERLEELQGLKESEWWNRDNYGTELRAEAWEAHEFRRRFCERHGLEFTSGWTLPGPHPEPINGD